MNHFFFALLLISLLFSESINAQQSNVKTRSSDTSIVYSLDDISTEGASARVTYHSGNIVEGVVDVYGETGKMRLVYVFSKNGVKVSEKQYAYRGSLFDVKNEEDVLLKKEFIYTIDREGKLLDGDDMGSASVFQEFRNVVPFVLRD